MLVGVMNASGQPIVLAPRTSAIHLAIRKNAVVPEVAQHIGKAKYPGIIQVIQFASVAPVAPVAPPVFSSMFINPH
jgi:hypothetical protein